MEETGETRAGGRNEKESEADEDGWDEEGMLWAAFYQDAKRLREGGGGRRH